LPEPVQGAAGEVGHRLRPLVVMDLCVSEPGAVIDDGVDELPAGPAGAVGAPAGHGVAGLDKARVALGVDVQEVAGAGPLVAANRPPRLPWPTRAATATQRPVDRCVGDAHLRGDQARTPAGPPAHLAAARLVGLAQHRRAPVWA